ncbi:MAG: sodium/proton-translocating pyrophosphatase, partial [Actinobacteria bacterium]|nr:sodium/proton-translocating pyrophosphatase [Actinomycetota bacterium]
MTGWVPWAVIASSIFGLAIAGLFAYLVLETDPGNEKMREISRSIQEGAMAFVSREYRYVGIFMVLMV